MKWFSRLSVSPLTIILMNRHWEECQQAAYLFAFVIKEPILLVKALACSNLPACISQFFCLKKDLISGVIKYETEEVSVTVRSG